MTAQVILVVMIFLIDKNIWEKYKLIYWVWLMMGLAIGSFIGHLQNWWQSKNNSIKGG